MAVTGGLIAGDRHISRALSHDHIDISQHISSTRFNKRSDKTAEGASGSVVAGETPSEAYAAVPRKVSPRKKATRAALLRSKTLIRFVKGTLVESVIVEHEL